MRAFVECRIKPYYLHHGDLAPGTAHLRTTLAQGQELMRQLRGRVSGLCQPDYVIDIPGGARQVAGRAELCVGRRIPQPTHVMQTRKRAIVWSIIAATFISIAERARRAERRWRQRVENATGFRGSGGKRIMKEGSWWWQLSRSWSCCAQVERSEIVRRTAMRAILSVCSTARDGGGTSTAGIRCR